MKWSINIKRPFRASRERLRKHTLYTEQKMCKYAHTICKSSLNVMIVSNHYPWPQPPKTTRLVLFAQGKAHIIRRVISSLADCGSVIDDFNERRFSFLCHFVWIQFSQSPQWMILWFWPGSARFPHSVREADAINEHESAKKGGYQKRVLKCSLHLPSDYHFSENVKWFSKIHVGIQRGGGG